MKKKLILYIVIVFLVLFSLINKISEPSACFSNVCVNLKIANSVAERQTGLMFRDSLPQDSGMLFIFEEEGEHSFWMKDTSIPLEIIWISQNLRIVDIQMANPCTNEPCQIYSPRERALYVLEVNEGFTAHHNIKLNHSITLHNL